MIQSLPDDFVQTVTATFDGGAEWLARLPEWLAVCERRWGLRLGPPFLLSYNYVAPAVREDGTEVVLKAGVPNKELTTEVAALRLYDGQGAVRLLDADPEAGLLLLERLRPGTMLSEERDDEKATAIAADVMRRLWRPVSAPHGFPTVADWARGMERLRAHFDGGTGPIPAPLVEEAERLFAELLPTQADPVLLHGDLHHFNILASEREGWLAIDPKGIVGEPAYEVGAFLRNEVPETGSFADDSRFLARRAHQFAEELGFDPVRVRDWAVAQAVLSAWWSIEDGGEVEPSFLRTIELLAAMPPK